MDHTNHRPEEIPLLRGVLHAVSCPLALIAGGTLAWFAPTPRAGIALLLMSAGYAAIFGTSGLYHRVRWTPQARRRARQLDHSMIYLGMATFYTAIWLVALDGWLADTVLVYAWIAALVGVGSKFWFLEARCSRHWMQYMGTGLVALVVIPDLWRTMGPAGLFLLLGGCAVIALGSIAYVTRRPNPIPGWVGHHELFHAGTVVGAALQLSALAVFVWR